MKSTHLMAMRLEPSLILKARGFEPDAWQRDVLLAQEREILLNCCRQAGKSTVTSAPALHTALFKPKSDVFLLSPGRWTHIALLDISVNIRDGYNSSAGGTENAESSWDWLHVPQKSRGTKFAVIDVERVGYGTGEDFLRAYLQRQAPSWPTNNL